MELEKEFRPYTYFIVYDFEALHKKMDEIQTEELVITSRHVPVSVAINDNLTNEPVFSWTKIRGILSIVLWKN